MMQNRSGWGYKFVIDKIKKIPRVWLVIGILLTLFIVGLLAWAGILLFAKGTICADWTGFCNYLGPLTKDQRGKTLWDWLQLLVIPIVLALAAFFFNRQERRNELRIAEERRKNDLEIAENRNQEAVLQNYFDKMNDLILEKNLMKVKTLRDQAVTKDNPHPTEKEFEKEIPEEFNAIRDMARVRTITVLRQLNRDHKEIVFQFLRDTGLASFILVSASLSHIDLSGNYLSHLNLTWAKLDRANLRHANLFRANLSGASLFEANLNRAHLVGANLREAGLTDASTHGLK